MHKSTLGIHKIELVIDTSPSFSNGSGVAQHAHCTLHLSKISTWDHSGWLIVNSNLESSWAPIYELDGTLGLNCCNCGIDIFGDDISTIQHATSHVFSMTRVTFHKLVSRFEASIGDL